MNDRIVTLLKSSFTEETWRELAFEFRFNEEDNTAYIHVIDD